MRTDFIFPETSFYETNIFLITKTNTTISNKKNVTVIFHKVVKYKRFHFLTLYVPLLFDEEKEKKQTVDTKLL